MPYNTDPRRQKDHLIANFGVALFGQESRSHRLAPGRREERLEARLTLVQKRLIERTAALRGTSVTEFVVASAQEWFRQPFAVGSR